MNELEAYCYLVDSLKQDSLEHKGVKGMKWKNHVYKTYQKGKASIKKLIKKIKKGLKNFADNWKVGNKELNKIAYAKAAKALKKPVKKMEKDMVGAAALYRKEAGYDYDKIYPGEFDIKRHALIDGTKTKVRKTKADIAMLLKDAILVNELMANKKTRKYAKKHLSKDAIRVSKNVMDNNETIDLWNDLKKKAGDRYE